MYDPNQLVLGFYLRELEERAAAARPLPNRSPATPRAVTIRKFLGRVLRILGAWRPATAQ